MRRHQLAQMLVIGFVASAVGVALALAIDWFPVQASSQADDIDNLYDVLLIASVPFFVLVEVVVLYSVWKFRMRPGQEDEDGPPIHGNTRLEVIWTAIPAIIVVGLVAWAWVVLDDIEAAQANEWQINVVGEQFAWTFEYPASVTGSEELVSNELYLPEGQPVRFNVTSKDVIHDFWVPEFRMKIDATPGITTHVRVTPTRLGNYPVVCAELCGLGHAAMRQNAIVVPRGEFDEWLEREMQGAAPAGATPAEAGKAVFTAAGCGACHVLADAGTTGAAGPNLDETLAGRDEPFILESIVNPNAEIAEGFAANVMPATYEDTLSEDELAALTAYLAEVTK